MECRSFVRQSASGAAGLTLASSIPATVLGANDRLRLGLIGCGSRGNFLLQQSRRRNPGLCPQCGHTPILIAATKRHKDAFVEKSMATVVDHVGSGARWRV